MAASQRYAGIGRAVGVRAVHLRLVPRPQSIVETGSILSLIQEFGPVEMFRSLKYDRIPAPYSMLAIFRTEEAALKLLRASPIRFKFSDAQVKHKDSQTRQTSHTVPDPEAQDDLGPVSSDRAALAQNAARHASAASLSKPAASDREYQLQVNVSTMQHRDQINVNPYHGPFIISRNKTAIHEDLASRVPLPGLSAADLKLPEKPWRVFFRDLEKGRKEHKTLRQMLDQDPQGLEPNSNAS